MKSKNIKILVGLIISIICVILLQTKVQAITVDEYINNRLKAPGGCASWFVNEKGQDLTEIVKIRCKTLLNEYCDIYNEYSNWMNGTERRQKITGTEFVSNPYYLCMDLHKTVGFNLGRQYEEKRKELSQKMINGVTDGTKIEAIKTFIEVDILNYKQNIFYKYTTINVNDNGEIEYSGGFDYNADDKLTDDQIIELIYALTHENGSQRAYSTSTIEEYESHANWDDDTPSCTVWGIRGGKTRNTQAEKAKQYREDINELKGEHTTGPVKGEKDGNYVKATVTSPINFKSEILKSVNEGGAKFNPTLKGNVVKDDNVEIKIPYEEGKNSYTVTVNYEYEISTGSFEVYFDGKCVGNEGDGKHYQCFIRLKQAGSPSIKKGSWTITITLEDTPTPEIEIGVTKQWEGSADEYPEITFALIADTDTISIVTIKGNGTQKFKNSEGGTKFPKEKNGKAIKYIVQENPSSETVTKGSDTLNWSVVGDSSQYVPSGGGTVTFTNKIEEKEPDEPEPSDGEPNLEVKKEVVYVFSDYEGNTSSEDVAPDNKQANVQRWDEVVFKITVTNTSKDGEEYEDDTYFDSTDPNEKVDKKDPEKKPDPCKNLPNYYGTSSTPSNSTHEKYYYTDQHIKCKDTYQLTNLNLSDEIEQVENLKIFKRK